MGSNMFKPDSTKKYVKDDPAIQEFLGRIPRQIAATFTNTQLAEIKRVFFHRVNNSHPVDIRLSLPFFGKRFYVVLFMGKDKRNQDQ